MKQRVFLAIGTIVLCAGLLAGCGKVTKSVEINYGETYKIEDEKLEGKENLTWESADAEIVEVADDGTVTAKAPGKAKVETKDLLAIVEQLQDKNVHLVSNKENLDTSTPTGKLMLTMIAAINEFERENLLERQREGIAIAKAEGKFKGGQVKRIDDKTFCAAYDRYQHRELNKTQLAAELKISRPTLNKLLKDKGRS